MYDLTIYVRLVLFNISASS